MKRLTVIASLLLVPTFIVGLYGQNFRHIPELALGLRLLVVVGPDRRDDDRAARGSSAGSAGSSGDATAGAACRTSSARTARSARSTTTAARACSTRGRRLPPLRLRLPVRADGRLLPGADDGLRRLRPGGPRPRDRARASSSSPASARRDLMGRDVVEALGLVGLETARTRSALALEWGVRQLDEQLELTTRAGLEKPVDGRPLPRLRRRRRPARRAHPAVGPPL